MGGINQQSFGKMVFDGILLMVYDSNCWAQDTTVGAHVSG